MNPYVIARSAIYWRFPSSTQRYAHNAAIAEVTKIAWQASDNTLWMLVEAPSTWIEIKTEGAGDYLALIADGAIGSQRVLKSSATAGKASYADKGNIADAAIVLGISRNAAADGSAVNIQYNGKMDDGAWTWAPQSPIYCGVSGVLTDAIPTSGMVIQVGTALSATSILVNIKQPFILN